MRNDGEAGIENRHCATTDAAAATSQVTTRQPQPFKLNQPKYLDNVPSVTIRGKY